eukprot:m.143758 g.143758  ORF g.143758 m.143758 type:complete len:302 (+) comp22999_c0_seq2:26-931(+)
MSSIFSMWEAVAQAPVSFGHLSIGAAIGACLGASTVYVGVLYYVTPKEHRHGWSRDDPAVIRRRALAVSAVTVLSPLGLAAISAPDVLGKTVLEHMGLSVFSSLSHALKASLIPLGLNVALFLGPLIQRYLDGDDDDGSLSSISSPYFDWLFLRNIVVAPVTEEIVFRGWMVPVLTPIVGSGGLLCVTAPLVFGIAHLHHAIEGVPLPVVLAQFGYTSVFGGITTYLFAATGHTAGPILCHAFSNFMGFPPFNEISGHAQWVTPTAPVFFPGTLHYLLLRNYAFDCWSVLVSSVVRSAVQF